MLSAVWPRGKEGKGREGGLMLECDYQLSIDMFFFDNVRYLLERVKICPVLQNDPHWYSKLDPCPPLSTVCGFAYQYTEHLSSGVFTLFVVIFVVCTCPNNNYIRIHFLFQHYMLT